jgi:Ice-binding-like/Putative Ig domain
MKRNGLCLAIAGVAGLLARVPTASAQVAPSLGTAQSFAVLSGTTITNTGASVITGDLGVSPGTAVTGFPPGLIVGGTIHAADALAGMAQNDVTTAYNSLAAQACTQDLTGQDLGGLTLTAGVYCFGSTAQLTGTLTLNAQGNPNAVFIFRIGSAITTASNSSVVVVNAASSCNVFWQVGSSATLGTNTTFTGNILALTSITATTGARVTGRTLARNGAVTLDTNAISPVCVIGPSACPAIAIQPAALPPGALAIAYSQTITASGGTAPYTFTVVAGTLPPGLTLTTAGVLAGTPTTLGPSAFTVRATDASGCFAQIAYTVVIAAAVCPAIALQPAALPPGRLGVAYSQTITASGGTAPYAFAVVAGTLPPGLTLTIAGVVAGTPTTLGPSTFTVRGTDANGCFAQITYVLVIAAATCPLITVSPAVLPAGTVGLPYVQQITASGGTGPYTFTLLTGTLPPGLSLTPAGLLSGSPTTLGSSTFTIQATDGSACPGIATYTIVIQAVVPTLPQAFTLLLLLTLAAIGYFRLRRQQTPE